MDAGAVAEGGAAWLADVEREIAAPSPAYGRKGLSLRSSRTADAAFICLRRHELGTTGTPKASSRCTALRYLHMASAPLPLCADDRAACHVFFVWGRCGRCSEALGRRTLSRMR